MPFINGEELARLREADAQVEDLRTKVQTQTGQLAAALAAGDVVQQVALRIEQLRSEGGLEDQVRGVVAFELEQKGRGELEELLSVKLREQMATDIMTKMRLEDGPRIRTVLDEMFRVDGTYDEIRVAAEVELRNEMAEQAKSAYEKDVRDEMGSEAAKAHTLASMVEELSDTTEGAEIRAQVRKELQAEWDEAVREGMREQAVAEVEADRETTVAQTKSRLESSYEFSRELERVRHNARQKFEELVRNELLHEFKNEVLNELIAERQELERAKVGELKAEISQQQLERDFLTNGIDMESVPVGARVTLNLGSIAEGNIAHARDKPENWRNHRVDMQKVERRIVAVATREAGYFRIESDSIENAASVYARAAAIQRGTVVVFGNTSRRNGESQFTHHLSAHHNLVYDDNTDDDNRVDAMIPVVGIAIDDVKVPDLHYAFSSDKNAFPET